MSIKISFVVPATSDRRVLSDNFLSSPCLADGHSHQILVQEGFSSAAIAYNDAIDRVSNDLIVFLHQDIILPGDWPFQLEKSLDIIESKDPSWGVLGCFGETKNHEGRGFLYSHGQGVLGKSFQCPALVQTLDEIVLIVRKSSGLRFDDRLPHFHLYGTDICMRAARAGMKAYAISAFCIHNTHQNLVLPREFYECCDHIKRVWTSYLPIQTTCIRITKYGIPVAVRKLREFYLRYFRRQQVGAVRAANIQGLLEEVRAALDDFTKSSDERPSFV